MNKAGQTTNFYEKIKPRLEKRIGREVRLAKRILDLGCGVCIAECPVQAIRQDDTATAVGIDAAISLLPNDHGSETPKG